MRKLVAGTGWKMNNGIAESIRYADELRARIAAIDTSAIDVYVLPPFTSLATAANAFDGSPVAIGGQNMHWEDSGSWTGEISAPMLREVGCRYVELAHSERLQHFGETYELVRRKLDKAMSVGLIPILCLGELAEEKAAELDNKVRVGAVIRARDIRLSALNANSKPVSRIKNAARLRVDFVLTANELATPGEKTVYVRITSPDGYVLTTEAMPTFDFEGERLSYSAMREVDYQNQDLEVGIYYNSTGFAAGAYTVQLFCDGRLIGTSQIAMR